ncbi:MAG: hypothetical protein ACYC3S_01620 [Chloroflexota bacterium]
MTDKQNVTLEPAEILEVQRILTDRDEVAALAFLRDVIWHRIKAANRKQINPREGTGLMG